MRSARGGCGRTDRRGAIDAVADRGAFLVPARRFNEYPSAILRKLRREIDPEVEVGAIP